MAWAHRLSNIDPEARIGDCAACGPGVRVRVRRVGADGAVRWRCGPGNPNARQASGNYRQFLKESCERCGFDPVDPCQLDVHHRDRDRDNNAPSNLETLCANCHRLEHAVA